MSGSRIQQNESIALVVLGFSKTNLLLCLPQLSSDFCPKVRAPMYTLDAAEPKP